MTYKRKTKIDLPVGVNPTPLPDDYHGHPAFYRIVEELKQLHSTKNKQYATKDNPLGNFYRTGQLISKFLKTHINPAMASCLSLMSKQVDGVYEIVGEGKTGTVDSLHDKLRDIAVYSIIAMIIIEEGDHGTRGKS